MAGGDIGGAFENELTFKHYYKSDSLIGTGTIKFRPYTIAEPLPQLAMVSNVSVDGTTVTFDEVENATSYEVLADGESIGTIPVVTMPTKGDLITIEDKQYRVLKIDGNVAEVLCMYSPTTSIVFDTNSSYNNTYEGKNIDTYCNDTFYNTLSSVMQSAIVDKTFTQDSWQRSSSSSAIASYNAKHGSSTYVLSLMNKTYGSSITRHCYCLSVQDVIDYLEVTTSMATDNTTLTDTNIWQMFWNQSTSISQLIWLRSADASSSSNVFFVSGSNGYLVRNYVSNSFAARPAFQIDLSKIEFTKVEK